METLNDVILTRFPELKRLRGEERSAVMRHLAPYLNDHTLDNLMLMPLQRQREVLAKLIVDMAVAKARCDARDRKMVEGFDTATEATRAASPSSWRT